MFEASWSGRMRRLRAAALVLILAFVAVSCSGGRSRPQADSQPVDTAPDEVGAAALSHGGIAIDVPDGWDGRVLFLDPQGTRGLLQVANFELPPNEGFESSVELPEGERDSIKAMTNGDVLIAVMEAGRGAAPGSLPVSIRASDFLPHGSPEIPRGHALARRAVCLQEGCVRIEVDFGSAPDQIALGDVGRVLSTLRVVRAEGGGTTQVIQEATAMPMMRMPPLPLRKCRSSRFLRDACPTRIPRVPRWGLRQGSEEASGALASSERGSRGVSTQEPVLTVRQ
jgi:hypothetical protein